MIVFLSLGSNLGDKKNTIAKAIEKISNFSKILKVSPEYITNAWGFISENTFLNSAIKISTELTAEELLNEILKIEKNLGRKQKTNNSYADREIDIDILFYGEEIISNERLIIPHPKLTERLFVLKPLNDISADFVHPIYKQTINELLNNCSDKSEIKEN